MSERISAGDTVTANNAEERRVLRLMREVNIITSPVPDSGQSKLVMRNEIRALMVEKGFPSFYITINPADLYNPLVKFLAGTEIDLDSLTPKDIPDYYEQSVVIAKNPSVTARFFNIYHEGIYLNIACVRSKSS
jgi:hypothetical protein